MLEQNESQAYPAEDEHPPPPIPTHQAVTHFPSQLSQEWKSKSFTRATRSLFRADVFQDTFYLPQP